MDTKTAERISQLARSMKDLHLVANIEEGYQKAREIIEGSPQHNEEKTVKEEFGIKEEVVETVVEQSEAVKPESDSEVNVEKPAEQSEAVAQNVVSEQTEITKSEDLKTPENPTTDTQ